MFKKMTGEITGPLEVPGALTVDGTVRGDVSVTGHLVLTGHVTGSVHVLLEGRAEVEAVIDGEVLVRGGSLSLRGIVGRGLGARPGTDVQVAAGTVVNGRTLQADGTFAPADQGARFSFDDATPVLRLQDDGTWRQATAGA